MISISFNRISERKAKRISGMFGMFVE